MRLFKLLFLLGPLTVAACQVVDPEYVGDPDTELAAILDEMLADQAPHDGERARLAVLVYRQAARHPTHVPTLMASAALAMEDNKPMRAETVLSRILSLDPTHAEARMLRARIAVQDGNLGLASELVQEGIDYRPDESRLHETAAWILYLGEHFDEAHSALDRAVRLDAPAWRVDFHRGLIEEGRGKNQAALRHYRACLRERPDYEPAKIRRLGLEAAM